MKTSITIILETEEDNSLEEISDMVASGLGHFDIGRITVKRGAEESSATYITREDNVIPTPA